MATVMMFVTTMIQTNENVSVRYLAGFNRSGPGTIPWMINAPSRIAMERLPGTPKASVGIKFPPSFALFAAPWSEHTFHVLCRSALYWVSSAQHGRRQATGTSRRPFQGLDRYRRRWRYSEVQAANGRNVSLTPSITPPSLVGTFSPAMLVP